MICGRGQNIEVKKLQLLQSSDWSLYLPPNFTWKQKTAVHFLVLDCQPKQKLKRSKMWESPATWGSRWCPFIPGSWSVIEAIYLPTLSGSASKPALKPTRLGPDPARSWPWTKNTWNLTGQAFYLQIFFIFVQQMSGFDWNLDWFLWVYVNGAQKFWRCFKILQ